MWSCLAMVNKKKVWLKTSIKARVLLESLRKGKERQAVDYKCPCLRKMTERKNHKMAPQSAEIG